MNINDKIKYQYMKLLYNKLNLKEIEEYIKELGIQPKKIVGDSNIKISDYFFLFNKIRLEELDEEQINKLNKYFSKDISEINNENNEYYEEMNEFLSDNIDKILFEKTESGYIGYGAFNPMNIVPADAVTFVFHYIRFNGTDKEKLSNLFDKLNYIQTDLSQKYNIKLAVIPCDETKNISVR